MVRGGILVRFFASPLTGGRFIQLLTTIAETVCGVRQEALGYHKLDCMGAEQGQPLGKRNGFNQVQILLVS